MIPATILGDFMLRWVVSAVLLAAVSGGTVAHSQTVAQIGGPAEQPPAGFSGQMYVDSRGCVFLKAGLAGRTTWVPRVSRDRKALCGYPPTRQAMAQQVPVAPAAAAPTAVAEAPAATPRATSRPMQTVATLTTPPRIKVANPPAVSSDPYLTRAVPAARTAAPVVAPRPVAVATAAPAPTVMAAPRAAAPVAVVAAPAAPVPAMRRVAKADPAPTVIPGPRAKTAAPAAAALAPLMMPAPRVAVAAPPPTVMSPRPVAQPVAVAQAPVRVAGPDAVFMAAAPGVGQVGCYASAPVVQVVALSNGGSTVLCTKGDGSLAGARAPIYDVVAMGQGPRSGAGIYAAPGRATRVADAMPTTARVSRPAYAFVADPVAAPITVPEGYKLAWKDDRLNPHRGLGTATGQAQQDQVWTRQVPAQLVAQPVQVVMSTKSEPQRPALQVSTKTEARAPVAAAPAAAPVVARAEPQAQGSYYVQVGSFGVPANAEGVRARLRAAGLPVGTATVTRKGKALEMVMAGPFGDAASAGAALRAVRGAGFGDAFIR